jgi:hypothetical protein
MLCDLGLRFIVQGHHDALARINGHVYLEVAEAQYVAIEQAARITFADRFAVAIDVNAIGTGVDEVVNATLEVDRGVTPRDIAIRIRQDPVVLQRAPDRAAFIAEDAYRIVTQSRCSETISS